MVFSPQHGLLCTFAGSDGTNLIQVAFPPVSALAEVLWSPRSMTTKVGPDPGRMRSHRCRMTQRGVPVPPVESGYCLSEYIAPTSESNADVTALLHENAVLRAKQAQVTALLEDRES